MQLRQLSINGFKSFADKTEIEFVPGLTGIVGPNGSGKSNITEAIRWALGEQSAKSLRGEKMGDVIFAGTASRPPLNRAEVVMTFDNSDGYLANQPATVSVCRRLYRDGESDFLLNNQAVRLKDIVDLFMDSGLGKESFSFISQGRVEAIFNSKPEDRRGILEEAAGVLKYKQQKAKANKELALADDNLARVGDIVHELQGRLAPLEEQASIARDYQRQNADLHKAHKAVLAIEIQQLAAEQDATATAAQVTTKLLAGLKEKLAKLEAQSETLTAADSDYEQRLSTVNDQLLSTSMRLEKMTGETRVSRERASNAQATLADLKERRDDAKNQLEEAQARLTQLHTQAAKQAADLAAAQKALQQADLDARDPKRLNKELDAAQADYIALLQEQATIGNQLASAKKDQQVSDSQNAALSSRVQELQKRVRAQKQQVATLEATLKDATAATVAAREAAGTASAAAQAATVAHDDKAERYQKALGMYTSTKARFDTLKELKEDYNGFFAGVRAVLQHKKQLPGVVGAVAELITVPQQYQQAFDIALGGSLQSIVTQDEQAAQHAIAYLKQQRAGRATFLPISVIKPRRLPANVVATLKQQPGFLGVGVDLIRYAQEAGDIMANLAGSLVVADNLTHAIAIARATGHRYRIVTLDGDLANVGGSMSGGQVKQRGSSPLARTQEVQTLAANLKQMSATLQAKHDELVVLAEQATAAQASAQSAQTAQATQAAAEQAAQAQLATQQAALTQLERQLQALGLDADAGVDFAAKIAALNQQVATVADKLVAAQSHIDATKAALATATTAAADRQTHLSELKAQVAVLQSAAATTQNQQTQWQQSHDVAERHFQDLQARIEKIAQDAESDSASKLDRDAQIAALKQAVTTLKRQQRELGEAKTANRGQLSQVSTAITNANRQKEAAQDDAQQQALTLNRVKINLDSRLHTLSEDYQLTYEAAKAELQDDPADLPMLKSRVKLLRRGIDELGAVNPNAIAEYDEVKQRHEFLVAQQDDLLTAKADLLKTMGELDEEVKTRFKQMFDATDVAFQEIFPKMFGGGHAHLSLTDPDDLLNSGLEISAQPPGKKLSRLSLLSGGERALTAIVLLFAILQVRPVPFSILDEVEASLDDVNVNRFGEFLKHYASDTQFIVITHRRGTMLAANVLYGVTMQESGVSRMMAVSLDDAVKQKEDHNGTV